MALDFSIPMQAFRGQFDPAEATQRAFTLRSLMDEQKLRQIQTEDALDKRNRAKMQRDLLSGAMTPDGQIDAAKVRGAFVQTGDLEGLTAFNTSEAQAAKAQREAKLAEIDGAMKQTGYIAQLVGGVRDEATWRQALGQARANGLDTSQFETLPYSPELVARIRSAALTESQRLEQEARQFTQNLQVAQFGETRRHNAATEGISAGNLEVARAREAREAAGGGTTGRQARRDETSLRKEFNNHPDVKAFNDVRQSYTTIQNIAKNPSAANDLAMIFSYMKMLDPGSVVREGEFANAQNAAGVPDRVRNLYNKLASGERLNPNQRRQFAASAGTVYRSRLGRYNALAKQYRSYAQDYGAEPDRVTKVETDGGFGGAVGGTLTQDQNGNYVWSPS